MYGNIIQLNEDLIKNNLKDLVRDSVEETLNALLDHEADELVRAGKYERTGDRKCYRSGHYERKLPGCASWSTASDGDSSATGHQNDAHAADNACRASA